MSSINNETNNNNKEDIEEDDKKKYFNNHVIVLHEYKSRILTKIVENEFIKQIKQDTSIFLTPLLCDYLIKKIEYANVLQYIFPIPLYIPLTFWFHRTFDLALPYAHIPYTTANVNINLTNPSYLIGDDKKYREMKRKILCKNIEDI